MGKRVSGKLRRWVAAFAGLLAVYLLLRGLAGLAVAGGRVPAAGAEWFGLPSKESWIAALGLFPASLILYGVVFIMVCGFGIPLGVLWGGLRTGVLRGAAGLVALLLMALPGFGLAYGLLWLSVEMLDAPVLRALQTPEETAADPRVRGAMEIWFVLMPASVLAIPAIGKVAGELQKALAENMRSPSMMALKSRGLSRTRRLYRYALPASWSAALRSLGAVLPAVIGASLLVEWIFSYPGLGARSFEAVRLGEVDFLFTVLLMLGVTVLVARGALDFVEAVFLEESEEE